MGKTEGSNSKAVISAKLNQILADSFALYLKTKNFHWHVTGPHFREYHLLLDEQATQILAITDMIAERVRKNGEITLKSIGDISRNQTLLDNDADDVSTKVMLTELAGDNSAFADSLREAKEIADDARDFATSALIDNWIDDAEQRAWFLKSSTEK